MRLAVLLAAAAQLLTAQTLGVIQKKNFWRDSRGRILISDEGITYEGQKKKESRTWKYLDVQYFDRISEKEFVILTYEDRQRYLGRDRQYHFVITEGALTDELFRAISARLGRPVTNRVVGEVPSSRYQVPVKHLHSFGGCEGTLKFTDEAIYYETAHEEDTREWLLTRDVNSVWSMNRYQLEIHVYDNNRREFSRTRVYKFDLKEPLDTDFLRTLNLRLYGLAARR